jgi:DNA-binding NarL/FixJ family response regulator
MTLVFIADSNAAARSALRLFIQHLHMEVVGEAADWETTFAAVPTTTATTLVVDGEVLPSPAHSALAALRALCPKLIIVLMSHRTAREQAAYGVGADIFTSKSDTPDRIAEHLQTAGSRP